MPLVLTLVALGWLTLIVEPLPLVFTLAALGVETVGAADPFPLLGAALVALG